ncbi:MAG: hypothetical protein ACK4WB_00585 [Desulfatiglandales bacterium]
MKEETLRTLRAVADYYDLRKVGDQGPLGFRRSTDLCVLLEALSLMEEMGIFRSGTARFMDLGCADGRVVLFMSYVCVISAGIELDEWTLEEYLPLRRELEEELRKRSLPLPDSKIFLFGGDALSEAVQSQIQRSIGIGIGDFDIYYTYLLMHEEFSRLVEEKAKKGAQFWVYGISGVVPRYPGMRLLTKEGSLRGILAVYEKL